ncbi:odorant receptor 94b-like [Belonocnema kinseyi]|uniref:odorant receptor 94b-like n=1 Tax=Belonocnema kinseyi TaxID=2817044 RepID=UPI00143DA55A|nr:odorant receptor 94b-like [Belonocnema kinseyi]
MSMVLRNRYSTTNALSPEPTRVTVSGWGYESIYERIVTWYTWHEIFHHFAYQSIGGIGSTFWGCSPLADYLNGIKLLPFPFWSPFDVTKSPTYEIIWLHQAVTFILCCINNVAIDILITGFMNVASCQFELLKCKISSIGEDEKHLIKPTKNPSKLSKNAEDQIYMKLCDCVRHNIAIFEFVAEIQGIFSTVICMQLFLNCLIICLTTFRVTQMTTYFTTEVAGNLVYTCCMTYQIFIYAWHGNELYLHNENISLAIYMGNWWKFGERIKHALRIMMLRTYRPLYITTWFSVKLSLSLFVAILQMSYTIFAFLRSSADNT